MLYFDCNRTSRFGTPIAKDPLPNFFLKQTAGLPFHNRSGKRRGKKNIWVWFGFRPEWSRTVTLARFTFLPFSPAKGEECNGSLYALRPRRFSHHADNICFRLLFFATSELFWHVYLFNLFILTSFDYNWQQSTDLTSDSVLDLSVTIMQKACEGDSSLKTWQ